MASKQSSKGKAAEQRVYVTDQELLYHRENRRVTTLPEGHPRNQHGIEHLVLCEDDSKDLNKSILPVCLKNAKWYLLNWSIGYRQFYLGEELSALHTWDIAASKDEDTRYYLTDEELAQDKPNRQVVTLHPDHPRNPGH